ncbi:MAG: cytochrome c oxidase subunit 3 [Candidatus Marinamargulisbacteria bacterium]|jgi:cytochrome c oxidase subunit 3
MVNQTLKTIKHHVAHHFDTAEQEFESAKLGMWLFIGQEILFFGALFVAYAVFRSYYPEMFVEAASHLSWKMGALNTVFLITSSLTMVLGVRYAQLGERRKLIFFLSTTFLFATAFLVVKYFEYMEKIHHGFLPSVWFSGSGTFEELPIFFGLYFLMTGLHGLHVLIGMGLIAWLIVRSYKGHFYEDYYTPVEMVGLYWHLVDMIWIFLFPMMYLIG